MEFSPFNKTVRLCLSGIELEEKSDSEEALKIFFQAWNESSNDYEKFIAAPFIARNQMNVRDRLKWYETALKLALKINDDSVNGSLSSLYLKIAKCHEDSGDRINAKKNYDLADQFTGEPSDKGPFYHGTKADLKTGDLLTAGFSSNYKPGLKMNHIYFTALPNGALLAAALAKGKGKERVYVVEPAGRFENDPNVTDKKFLGNPSRSYRTSEPLKIIGEIKDLQQSNEQVKQFRKKLKDNNEGDIIN